MTEWIDGILTHLNTGRGREGERARGGEFFFPSPLMREGEAWIRHAIACRYMNRTQFITFQQF